MTKKNSRLEREARALRDRDRIPLSVARRRVAVGGTDAERALCAAAALTLTPHEPGGSLTVFDNTLDIRVPGARLNIPTSFDLSSVTPDGAAAVLTRYFGLTSDAEDDIAGALSEHAETAAMFTELVETADAPSVSGGCPDGGTCHHGCFVKATDQKPDCFRVRYASPLSNVFPGDRWPVELTGRTGDEPGVPVSEIADRMDVSTTHVLELAVLRVADQVCRFGSEAALAVTSITGPEHAAVLSSSCAVYAEHYVPAPGRPWVTVSELAAELSASADDVLRCARDERRAFVRRYGGAAAPLCRIVGDDVAGLSPVLAVLVREAAAVEDITWSDPAAAYARTAELHDPHEAAHESLAREYDADSRTTPRQRLEERP